MRVRLDQVASVIVKSESKHRDGKAFRYARGRKADLCRFSPAYQATPYILRSNSATCLKHLLSVPIPPKKMLTSFSKAEESYE